ncbi:YcnI family protein [Agromyces sp. NPDC060279]|uniref:YcnI family copper-binding membrane protein n=1 Tax=Agromyces sp. NPDC060279 TaxID=3347092 RepID=UPI00365400B1
MTTKTHVRPALVTAAALGAGALLALGAPLAASAHVGVDSTSTAAGAYTVLSFGIPHGCGTSPTTKLTFTMPEGIDRVTPTVNAGWTIETVVEKLPEPKIDSHGASVVDRVAQVVYTATTPLPSDLRDVIELSLQLPADAEGETLAFPVLQECVEGSTDWSEPVVEGEEEPEHPAPSIAVTAAEEGGHHGAAAPEHGDEHESSDAASDDGTARALGVTGIAVGVLGLGAAIAALALGRRSRKAE